MKKIKLPLLALAVLIAVAGAFAGNKPNKGAHTFNNKYRYLLPDNSGMTDPSNYEYTSSTSGCGGGTVVCIIESPGPSGDGQHPSFEQGTDPNQNDQGVSVFSKKQ